MSMFTQQLTLKCSNGGEAMKKLKKLMKRGCTDDNYGRDPDNIGAWNARKALQHKDEICYLVVHTGGAVLIVNHAGEGNFIERVRDVENYRVK